MFTYPNKLTPRDCRILLGVDETAGLKEIKRAFRKQVRRLHPDLNPGHPEAEQRLQQVIQAYRILADTTSTRKDRSELARIFRQTGGQAMETRQRGPLNPTQLRSRVWAAGGLLLGAAILVILGGPSALLATPAPYWPIAALGLGGAWVSVRILAPAGRFRTQVLTLSLLAGILAGGAAGYGFLVTLDQYMYDAARVWFALASGAAGGLAGTLHQAALAREMMGPALPG